MSGDRDRSACYELTVATYCAVDDGSATSAIGAFTPDATMDRYGELRTGTAAIRSVLAAREAQQDRITCHSVTNYAYHRHDENNADAQYSLLVFLVVAGSAQLAGVRRCRETYRRETGRWLIGHRQQRYLGTA